MIEKYTELLEELPPARDRDEADWALFNAYTEILEDLKSCQSCTHSPDASPVSSLPKRPNHWDSHLTLSTSENPKTQLMN